MLAIGAVGKSMYITRGWCCTEYSVSIMDMFKFVAAYVATDSVVCFKGGRAEDINRGFNDVALISVN